MANPRKFSDKLEIIRRKEEEANAAFVKIMREVSDARKTTGPLHLPPQNNWARGPSELMNMRQKFKGGSLPNVNMSNPMNMQSVYPPGMSDLYRPRQSHHPQQSPNYIGGIASAHLRRTMEPPSGPIYPRKNKTRSYTVNTAPYRNNLHHQSQNLIPEQNESQTSMWRRTYSDSAIQQTLQQPPKKNGDGSSAQQGTPPRVHHPLSTVDGSNESQQQYASSSSGTLAFNSDSNSLSTGKNIQMQANTSSLPDLSNLSIPSPIQNPIDVDQDGKNSQQQNHSEQQHAFQVPFRVPASRIVGKQIYPRQLSSNPDVLESLHREQQKLHLNLYSTGVIGGDKNEINLPNMSNSSVSHSAPLSPVTPPPYYWNSTPMSPLATSELLQQVSVQHELQQQMQQFQIHGDSGVTNGMGNPPPYSYINQNESENGGGSYNYQYMNNKQNLYRINSGPAQLTTGNNSKAMCDRQLESELQRLKAQDHELSEADLNSVRVALDPLDFNDVQILTDENTELVDQSAEEGFRLERAGYQ